MHLYAINPDGTQKWTFKAGRIDTSAAVSREGIVYIASQDGHLNAINPDGTQKWAFKTTPGRVFSISPSIGADGTIYTGFSGNGHLYAINSDGTQKWAIKIGVLESAPAIARDGTIFVGTGQGTVHAINPNGTQRWVFETGNTKVVYSSPAIAPDGTIYVGSTDGRLYAIKTNSLGLANSAWPMYVHDLRRANRK